METAIGVFSSRERAEETVRELIAKKVPEEAIVVVTRAQKLGEDSGTPDEGLVPSVFGLSARDMTQTLLLPGLGPVITLRFGAVALLGVDAGETFGKEIVDDILGMRSTAAEKASDEADFLRDVLREGRSIVIVRNQSSELANVASGILDRMGMQIHGLTLLPMRTAIRQIDDIAIVDLGGRITVAQGNVLLRDVVRDLLDRGIRKILFNLLEVGYVDSSGLGELVRAHTSIRNRGGQLKLAKLSMRVNDLIHITMLHTALDIYVEEADAIRAFSESSNSRAVA